MAISSSRSRRSSDLLSEFGSCKSTESKGKKVIADASQTQQLSNQLRANQEQKKTIEQLPKALKKRDADRGPACNRWR
jgi:hypothetical protein